MAQFSIKAWLCPYGWHADPAQEAIATRAQAHPSRLQWPSRTGYPSSASRSQQRWHRRHRRDVSQGTQSKNLQCHQKQGHCTLGKSLKAEERNRTAPTPKGNPLESETEEEGPRLCVPMAGIAQCGTSTPPSVQALRLLTLAEQMWDTGDIFLALFYS